MNKMVKLSLVTAVALAGLSSVNAASLEEAIKGVDVSGMVRYRYNDKNVKNGESTQNNDYDIELTAKIPVNDSVKATIKFDFSYDYSAQTADGGRAPLNIEDAFFTYTNPNFIASAGKQNVPGPQSDGINGTGIVLTGLLDPVSLVGTYFNSTQVSHHSLWQAAVLGSFGPVNASLWYADVADTLDAYTLALSGDIGPVSLSGRYSKRDNDGDKLKLSVAKLNASVNWDVFTIRAGFARTSKDNAGTGAAIDTSEDSEVNNFQLKQLAVATGMNDAKAFMVGASFKPTENTSLGLDYLSAKYKDKADNKVKANETAISASYAMSSNFKISSYYSLAKDDSVKSTKGRLELKYSF